MAGYSQRPLAAKLGIKSGQRAIFIHAPNDYMKLIAPLPDEFVVARRLSGSFDFIHFFAATRVQLERELPRVKKYLARDGSLWISWPKVASRMATDVTETIVRSTGLAVGLVDIKVCAVDDVWSGLKFVYRRADR